MRRSRRVCVELSALVAFLFTLVASLFTMVALARAQIFVAPSPEDTAPAGGMTGGMFVVALMMALLIIGVATKIFDRARKRRDVLALQSRIADALLADSALGHLPVTVTTHAPLWRSSRVIIEIRGQVPTPALQKAAINLLLQEACSCVGAQFRVEDGIVVVPSMPRAA